MILEQRTACFPDHGKQGSAGMPCGDQAQKVSGSSARREHGDLAAGLVTLL